MLPKFPNYLWDQLAEDRLAASFIVDGIHLDTAFLRVALRAKGIERSILVTERRDACDVRPGRYELGDLEVELKDDRRVSRSKAAMKRLVRWLQPAHGSRD